MPFAAEWLRLEIGRVWCGLRTRGDSGQQGDHVDDPGACVAIMPCAGMGVLW